MTKFIGCQYEYKQLRLCRNQTYNQHRLMMILFKEYMAVDYRSFTQRLELIYPVIDKLELENVPHFTTLKSSLTKSLLTGSTGYSIKQ
jgi:hypothetical protein